MKPSLDRLKAIFQEAVSLATSLAGEFNDLNPALTALAFRLAAEHSEYALRSEAGDEVFDSYVAFRDQVVVKSSQVATKLMLSKVRS